MIKRLYPPGKQDVLPELDTIIERVEMELPPENRAEKMTELAQIILAKYGKG